MKKLVSIFLAIAILFTFGISALADDTNVTITEGDRSYNAYKLLEVTSSLKAGHTAHDGDCDRDACYNYSYTLGENNPYVDILKAIVNPTTPNSVTEEDIITFLDNSEANKQEVADAIYRAIIAADIDPDATIVAPATTATIEQGYWLFADVTGLTGNKTNSVVVLKTKGLEDITISPKTAVPEIDKEVYEINDTTGVGDWSNIDAADYDIGDNVRFKLTAKLPENFASYGEYTLIFKDNLADGFTLNDDITVTANTNGTPVTLANNTYSINKTVTGYDFAVEFENIVGITGVTAETEFVVEYTAKLTAAAVVGGTGNRNTVDLEFTNDPYGDTTGTISDYVTVYTYKLVIDKVTTVNGNNVPVAGATFTLKKQDSLGAFNTVAITSVPNGDGTSFTYTGLDAGVYKLIEDEAPAGYNKIEDITFTVGSTYTEDALATLTSEGLGTTEVATGTITAVIVNSTGTALPETGAKGTMWLIGGGATLAICAAVFMITRKKMSVFED